MIVCDANSFRAAWHRVMEVSRGTKVRSYERMVRLQAGGGVITLSAINDVAAASATLQAVSASGEWDVAISMESLISPIVHMEGQLTIDLHDHGPRLLFSTSMFQQIVDVGNVDDFPGLSFAGDKVICSFDAGDLGKRLRLARNSATKESGVSTSVYNAVRLESKGGVVEIETADPVRGVSKVTWDAKVDNSFMVLIPLVNVDILVGMLRPGDGSVTVLSDSGGNRLVWKIGNTVYVSRVQDGQWSTKISALYDVKVLASAVIDHPRFEKILRLIASQSKMLPIANLEIADGVLTVSSSKELSRANIPAATEGAGTIAINAKQIVDVLDDLKSKEMKVKVDIGTSLGRSVFRMTVPGNDEYVHVAVPYTPREEKV